MSRGVAALPFLLPKGNECYFDKLCQPQQLDNGAFFIFWLGAKEE